MPWGRQDSGEEGGPWGPWTAWREVTAQEQGRRQPGFCSERPVHPQKPFIPPTILCPLSPNSNGPILSGFLQLLPGRTPWGARAAFQSSSPSRVGCHPQHLQFDKPERGLLGSHRERHFPQGRLNVLGHRTNSPVVFCQWQVFFKYIFSVKQCFWFMPTTTQRELSILSR